jgi:hypothetical protein
MEESYHFAELLSPPSRFNTEIDYFRVVLHGLFFAFTRSNWNFAPE